MGSWSGLGGPSARRLSPSMRHLAALIRKHFVKLKIVKTVYLSQKGTKTVVWVVCGQSEPRMVRALKAREAQIAALRPDLNLDFWKLWLEGSKFLKSLTAAEAKRIYQKEDEYAHLDRGPRMGRNP